jgi:hypothetical protein
MYIKKIEIRNIRAVEAFEMTFEATCGWHVLIGDNGAGKSSIIRSIALALIGPHEAPGLRADWRDWLKREASEGSIGVSIEPGEIDYLTGSGKRPKKGTTIPNEIYFKRNNGTVQFSSNASAEGFDPLRFNWGDGYGWFSAAYGPFRRFGGGNPDWSKVFFSQPTLGAHLSAFGEDVALTEAIEWLVKLNYQELEKGVSPEQSDMSHLKRLINSSGFLPHNTKLEKISSEGVFFIDGNGSTIHVNQLSDGYRSLLSLTFELIRQLVRVYGPEKVFSSIQSATSDEDYKIDVPGVVLVDEIDAHLHPTWQTRIGEWFTKYFPKIQFIVTTHSPLVCRASEKGTVWRLAAPGSGVSSGEITGVDKEKLVFGNILDAYGTEIFGSSPVRSEKADERLSRLGRLNMLAALGKISNQESKERQYLQKVFSTNDPTGY